jgi:hypothetical protein
LPSCICYPIELFVNSPCFNQRLDDYLCSIKNSYIEIWVSMMLAKHYCIEICAPIKNKNEMNEVRSWMNLWMKEELNLQIPIIAARSNDINLT